MRSRLAAFAVTLAVGVVALASTPAVAAPAPAKAAVVKAAAAVKVPKRNDGLNEPIYFVHGIQVPKNPLKLSPSADCNEWAPAIKRYKQLGATSTHLITVAYYKNDKNCNLRIGNFSNKQANLNDIARALANNIYNNFTKNGVSVDLVGHSMGGLIIRAAITGVQKHWAGFPPRLYVEDAVTFSTPHTGAGFAKLCAKVLGECKQMAPGSAFLKSLNSNPQSTQGTDWTLIGSKDDKVVNWTSALSTGTPNKEAGWISAGHKVVFAKGQGLGHSDIYKKTTGSYNSTYWNFYTNKWITQKKGAAPVVVARNADYYWRLW